MKNVFFYFIKYTFRLLHVSTFGIIFGNILLDYLFGKRSNMISENKQYYTLFHVISSVILIISGLINMIILVKENKYLKNTYYQIWKKILIWKLIFTFALTPILDKLIKDQSLCFKMRFVIVCSLLIISPFLRYFREYCLTPQKDIANEINTQKVN